MIQQDFKIFCANNRQTILVTENGGEVYITLMTDPRTNSTKEVHEKTTMRIDKKDSVALMSVLQKINF